MAIKNLFRELHRVIGETVATVKAGGSPKIDFNGTAAELVAAYQEAWDAGNASCALSYTNSDSGTRWPWI